MVQKSKRGAPRRRGRPRAYDPQQALSRALEVFWTRGYSGTSLDDIAAATGMNRPSLYAAFGDKRALYLKALAHYYQQAGAEIRDILAADEPLCGALMRIYESALRIYLGRGQARGCFAIGTATTEAVADPEVRAMLAESTRRLDQAFEARIRTAQNLGDLLPHADPAALASLASATLHTIAIRARAGIPRAELVELARKAVSVICGDVRSEPRSDDRTTRAKRAAGGRARLS
ncbi:MAG: TetR/AcrR family transcriptional regulator [Gammaproteobacteria bacterium]|nr:TetR/AcrR family transcriptional regulator [Gammaproteobacteria bacterium]